MKTKKAENSIYLIFVIFVYFLKKRVFSFINELFFTVNREALLGLGIGVALNLFSQLTACFTIMNYGVMTFTKLGIPIDPNVASITLALSLIFGSLTTTYLADKFGRKTLILFSLMGSAFGLLSTALYYYLDLLGYEFSAFGWVQIFSLSVVIFLPSAGITPLAIICSVEYLPTKVYKDKEAISIL